MAERHSSSALDSHAARITQDMRRAIAAPVDRYVTCFARQGRGAGHDLNGRTPLRRRVKLWTETIMARPKLTQNESRYQRLSTKSRKAIGRLRCVHGWSIRRVARKFGVTHPTVIWWQYEWEAGRWKRGGKRG